MISVDLRMLTSALLLCLLTVVAADCHAATAGAAEKGQAAHTAAATPRRKVLVIYSFSGASKCSAHYPGCRQNAES